MGNVKIGLKQAQRLAGLSQEKRLSFLAEGFPMIRDSAFSFMEAARVLENNTREQGVLIGFAEEEAAKGLILMDIVRCPAELLHERMGPMLRWFYNHLARLIYANATTWKPVDTTQLQEYIDSSRQAYELEGYAGEYIIPNWEEYRRESELYVDIAAFEDGEPVWSSPLIGKGASFEDYVPTSLQVIDALHHLGLTSAAGLKATHEVWSTLTFRDKENPEDTDRLTRHLLERAVDEKLPLETATQNHVRALYQCWQLPMYMLDLRKIDVPLAALKERRDMLLWSEIHNFD